MNGLIAVTDHEWFEFLSRQQGLDEVNFWRPSDTRTPRQMQPGMPVLFKLRKHYGGWIVGFGLFARHSVLPAWLAWDAFGLKNGAVSFADMRRRIERLRHGHKPPPGRGGADYSIGCLMLSQPAFLEREHWVRSPRDWPENAVQGKAYDLASGEGARVWSECLLGARTSAAEEVAALLSCSEAHVWRMNAGGKMPTPVKLLRLTRWRAAEMTAWINAGCPPRSRWYWTQGRTG